MPAFGSGNPTIAQASAGADYSAKASGGRLCSVGIFPTGAVTPTCTIFDANGVASGKILFGPFKIQSGVPTFVTLPDQGINAMNGMFVHLDSWTTVQTVVYVK